MLQYTINVVHLGAVGSKVQNLCSDQSLNFGGCQSQSLDTCALSTDLVPESFLILCLS